MTRKLHNIILMTFFTLGVGDFAVGTIYHDPLMALLMIIDHFGALLAVWIIIALLGSRDL